MTVWTMALLGAALAAPQPTGLTEATLDAGDLRVEWQNHRGMSFAYRGVRAFDPYAGEFTLHDKAWTKAFYSSGREKSQATLFGRGQAQVLEISDDTEHFSYRKTVTVEPRGRILEEFEYGQKDLDDASLQLGWQPVVAWLEGARYRVVAGGKEEQGEMTRGFSGRKVLWSGLTEAEFTSVFGTWKVRSSHPMILYDYRERGTFWLGWDTPLDRGKRYSERVEISFEPGFVEVGGVRLSDLSWTREVTAGYFALKSKLVRLHGGPDVAALVVDLKRGEQPVDSRRRVVQVEPRPGTVTVEMPLSEPGEYVAQARLLGTADKQILALPALAVSVEKILSAVPGLSLYTAEKQGEIIVRLSDSAPFAGRTLVLRGDGLPDSPVPLAGRETVAAFDIAPLADGLHVVDVELRQGDDVIARTRTRFVKAPPAPNEVKIDYRTRGLIVDGKPFFPFGFYTHAGRFYDGKSAELLPDLESPNKFNMICVYHPAPAEVVELRPNILQFLDSCDAVGMRSHYDIRHLCDSEATAENEAQIQDEMHTHRGAPSLLCWYLSDEPAARQLPPERFINRYATLKEWDPYHPTTMVFCVPERADEFLAGLDIMMVDPYPIPSGSVTRVGDVVELVRRESLDEAPVWCVPQAFGGGEWWAREPTPEEERCMTYLAIVHGATGIQYFIRRPPWNNPFVPALWAEIQRMAQEIKELTPALLSREARPEVTVLRPGQEVHAAAWAYRGRACVIAVNTQADPTTLTLQCAAKPVAETARVLWEQRTVPLGDDGTITDAIEGFGVRVYEYALADQPDLTLEGNLVNNGSFEAQTNVGYPDYYHVGQGSHLGASWGTDPLEARHGEHSLFIRCPADGQGPSVVSYPMTLKPGKYEASVWLKADRAGLTGRLQVSGFKDAPAATADLGREWSQASVQFEVPEDTRWVHVSLSAATRGTLWADELIVRSQGPAD